MAKTHGKLPLGKLQIGEVATWEKSFGKVPNVYVMMPYSTITLNLDDLSNKLLTYPKT